MVAGDRSRVLIIFETQWDRRQLAACEKNWCEKIEVVFAAPPDDQCRYDFDVLGFVEAVAAGAFGFLDGVWSSSDYPGASVAAAIATRLNLPGPHPERVIGASHKYYSRLAQARAVPAAVPRFGLIDAAFPEAPTPLAFPCFVKPVKGAFSILARRIENQAHLTAFLSSPAVREFTSQYVHIFNRMLRAWTGFAVDGRHFLAEELLAGQLVTVEGFMCNGEVLLLGIVDSSLDARTGSFTRFDYPSVLPPVVQKRMQEIARRIVHALDLERSFFNIEMVWQPETDRIAVIEVNPRICGQFADLYQKVDGSNSYALALALCLGERPRPPRGRGTHRAAASFPLRVFESVRVAAAPEPEQIRAAEARFPGTLIWSECCTGDVLSVSESNEDGGSCRYAIVNLGGTDRADLGARCEKIKKRLGYVLDPLWQD